MKVILRAKLNASEYQEKSNPLFIIIITCSFLFEEIGEVKMNGSDRHMLESQISQQQAKNPRLESA